MKKIVTILLVLFTFNCFAQNEAEISIGDTLVFYGCSGESFQYIDLYKKTRVEVDSINYDTMFEWTFYNTFFETGDFDVTRLPCSYEGKRGIIKHMMLLETEDGMGQTVVIAKIEDELSAAYIIEDAFINEEIIYIPKE